MSSNGKFDSLIGQVIDKRYKVLSVIGEGGMAVVFKAHDMVTDRTVAIKVLNEANDTDGQAVKRFLNESKAIAMLSHENIVKIYDVSVGRELKYIVMEHVDGNTLKGYMDKNGKKLSIEEALGFTEQILLALEHAHSKKVIHRDIKPHNIMVLKNGFIKVTDFGIAKTPSGDTISMTDKALGTVYYVSPEQVSGKETGTFSDIYSVGVMLYEMATGKLPFYADSPVTVAMQQINDEPELPCTVCPDLPRGMEQIILKAMNKDPEKRFKSAHSMLRAIRILKENPMVVFEETTSSTTTSIPLKKSEEKKEEKKSIRNGVLGKVFGLSHTKKRNANEKRENNGSKVTMFPIVMGISIAFFVVLVVSVIVALFVFNNKNNVEPVTVEVPDNIVGQVYSEKLFEGPEYENFIIVKEELDKYNDAYGFGVICRTWPKPGSEKKIPVNDEDQKIELTIYCNPEISEQELPDYSIQRLSAVKTSLANRGFDVDNEENVVVHYLEHETVSKGYVIETKPEAGTKISPEDKVEIYVSLGRTLNHAIAMPNLEGSTKGQAIAKLGNFDLEFKTVAHEKKKGTIISQSITPQTVISPEFCDTIIFYVSDGSLEGQRGYKTELPMPSLVDMTLGEARDAMLEFEEYGIVVEFLPETEGLADGIISAQSIPAGESVPTSFEEIITVTYKMPDEPAQEPVDVPVDTPADEPNQEPTQEPVGEPVEDTEETENN